MNATDKLQKRPAFNASPSDVVCQWQRNKGVTRVRAGGRARRAREHTYACTRAGELSRIASRNLLQPEFVKPGLEYSRGGVSS